MQRQRIVTTDFPLELDAFLGDDPDAICASAFALLMDGSQRRQSPFRTLALATRNADGTPDARTVVLRGFDKTARQCRMHTDVRSPKVSALRSCHLRCRARSLGLSRKAASG
ncbi:MAG: hypothetical protein KIT83_19985, partial [Bryobacterales bacterium]|nr:hypothetical protein [Bryobacterales bacterium]